MAVRRRASAKWITQLFALILTICAGLAVLFVPGYQVVTSDSDGKPLVIVLVGERLLTGRQVQD